jgi:hypothetical protein
LRGHPEKTLDSRIARRRIGAGVTSSLKASPELPETGNIGGFMQNVDYANFNFGERLNSFIHEVMNFGGAPRTEADLTEGQKVFVRAVKREMVKYADPNRHGYPHNLLEQMESFTRTIGDLHNSYFDSGMRKVSDCLYNRWKMLYEETKKLAAAGGDTQPAWVDVIKTEQTDMPAFFDA